MRVKFGETNACLPKFGLDLPLGKIPSLASNKCFSTLSKKDFIQIPFPRTPVEEMETPFCDVTKQLPPTKPAFSLFPKFTLRLLGGAAG